MRAICIGLALSIFVFLGAAAQTPAPAASNPQALQILRQSLAALSPNVAVQDVTISGTVRYIAGSEDETGTAALKATVLGDARIDLSLPSGTRSETYNLSGEFPGGQWTDRDSVPTAIPYHNLMNEPAWFSPAIFLSRRLNDKLFAATYVGLEMLASRGVQHIAIVRRSLDPVSEPARLQRLTQIDLYLDSVTFLPALLTFKVHADSNVLINIPVDVRFSDYRTVNGAQVPFRIEKFFNKSLLLDLRLDSAEINTGLSSASFHVM